MISSKMLLDAYRQYVYNVIKNQDEYTLKGVVCNLCNLANNDFLREMPFYKYSREILIFDKLNNLSTVELYILKDELIAHLLENCGVSSISELCEKIA